MLLFSLMLGINVVLQSSGETLGCGKTSLAFLDRETREVKPNQYPSMCNVFTQIRGQRVFLGGASLIQCNQVVTLATLVDRLRTKEVKDAGFEVDLRGDEDECGDNQLTVRDLSVICGTVDLQSQLGDGPQIRNVSRILIHPEYSSTQLINDLAVLILEEPFDYTDSVSQVCLPRPNQELQEFGERCIALGHGQDSWPDANVGFGPTYSRGLLQVSLPLWESSKCQEELNLRHFMKEHGFTWKIHPSFLCAGGEENEDTCRGDGGGPLLCEVSDGEEKKSPKDIQDFLFGADDLDLRGAAEPTRLVQAGVTAWGIQCGTEGVPAAYSDLRHNACWLDQVMSCNPDSNGNEELVIQRQEDLINLRQARNVGGPKSVNRLTESECGAWLKTTGADMAACGCRQNLSEEEEPPVVTPSSDLFNLRANEEPAK